jgi:protein-S-isoprenylcysteine O-methyltransferase Ste14
VANDSTVERAGRFLFRWRGAIGFLGFWVVFWWGRATIFSCVAGLPLLAAGLAVRWWAMGYVGGEARAGEVGGDVYVGSGPYRWFRLSGRSPAGHPLYFGNFLLVVGTLVALWPPVLLGLLVLVLFLFEYTLMARAEERHLGRRFRGVADHNIRFEARRARPEWRTALAATIVFGLALAKALLG